MSISMQFTSFGQHAATVIFPRRCRATTRGSSGTGSPLSSQNFARIQFGTPNFLKWNGSPRQLGPPGSAFLMYSFTKSAVSLPGLEVRPNSTSSIAHSSACSYWARFVALLLTRDERCNFFTLVS